jgi:hypothetical protein
MRLKVWLGLPLIAFLDFLYDSPSQANIQCTSGAWGGIKCETDISFFYIDSNPPQGLSNLMDIEEMPVPYPPRELTILEVPDDSPVSQIKCTVISPECFENVR